MNAHEACTRCEHARGAHTKSAGKTTCTGRTMRGTACPCFAFQSGGPIPSAPKLAGLSPLNESDWPEV